MNKFILSIVFLISAVFGLFISSENLAFAVTPPTVVAIPAPVVWQEQWFISAIWVGWKKAFAINNRIVTHDWDTVFNYFGGLTTVWVWNIVNYSYIIDVDWVYIATSIDVYPTQAVSGTARVNRLDVTNATSWVALTLYNGTIIEYFQPYAFITGLGTNTSFGCQLVNYVGFLNPVNWHIIATSGYMSNIPVNFVTQLPDATVWQPYNAWVIDLGIYGMADIYSVTAVGMPAWLTLPFGNGWSGNRGIISGVPTTPGTYTINFTAIWGQRNVAPYQVNGTGSVTLVVKPATPVTPTTTPCSGTDEVILWTTARLSSIADVNWNIINAAYATTSNNNIAIPANWVNYTFSWGLTNGSFPIGGLISYTWVYGSALNANGTPMWCIPTDVTVSPVPVAPTPVTPVTFVSTIPNAILTQAYTWTSLVSTWVAPYSVTASWLPIGMSVSADWVLSGTPYSPVWTYTISLTATDSAWTVWTGTVDLVIDSAPVVTVTGNGYIWFVSKFFININGWDTWAASVYYTPTPAGTTFLNWATTFVVWEYVTFTWELLANWVINATSMTVDSIPTPVTFIPSLSNATVWVSYTGTSLVSTGTAPYTVTATGLPTGMTVSTSGVLSGKATTAWTYTINLTATDSRGTVWTTTLTLVVNPAPVIVTPPSTTYTSTGKKAESQGKITSMTTNSYTVWTVVVRITPTTITKLNNNKPFAIWMQVEYKGILNTDASVTASSFKAQ